MSMQGTSENVLTAFTFSLEIDNVSQQNFTAVNGLSVSVEVVDTWGADAAAKTIEQKVAGAVRYGDISVTANFSTNSYIRDWRQEVIEGKYESYRRNGSIVLYDGELNEQARWNFVNGWPSSYSLEGLAAGNSQVVGESITIVHEGLERA